MGKHSRRAARGAVGRISSTPSVSELPIFVGALLLYAATLIAYVPAIRAGFVWDDDFYVTNNSSLQTADGLRRIWLEPGATPQYYPLVFTTFWIEQRIWGNAPAGYHVVNILLHATSALILWRLARFMRIPGALLAALLFALHPVQVESVAWVTERKNVLSGVLYFAALWFHARFAEMRTDEPPRARDWSRYAFAIALFLGALLSKSVTASLPAVFLILLWWRRGRFNRTDVLALLPMFALGAAMGLHTAWFEQHRVGAAGEEWDLTFLQRFLVAGRAVWFYLSKLLYPVNLTFIYPRWTIDASSVAQYVLTAAALLVVIAAWIWRGVLGRGPLAAALCFVGTLFPALGFLNVYPFRYSFVADHFQYLACVFVLVPLAALCGRAMRGVQPPARVVAGAGLVLVLGILTWRQSLVYADMKSLWDDVVNKNPGAWMAHGNLGDYLSGQRRFEEAAAAYRRSLEIRPQSAQIHYNLGLALTEQRKPAEAVEQYRIAVEQQPKYPQAWVNLGAALLSMNKPQEALPALQRAIEQDPNLAAGPYNMGNLLMVLGRFPEAYERFRDAERLKPNYVEAIVNAGNALRAMGRVDEAEKNFRRAIELAPDSVEAHLNLGSSLVARDPGGALRHLEKAVQLRPAFDEGHYRLGRCLAAQGRIDEAIREMRETLRLNPKHPSAQTDLKMLMEKK